MTPQPLVITIIILAVFYLMIMFVVTSKRPPKRAARQEKQASVNREPRRVRLIFPNLGLGADETTELVADLTWEADAIDVSGKRDGYLTLTLTTSADRTALADALGRDDFDFEEVADDGTA